MRQVQALLKVINKAHLTDFYNSLLSYGTVHGLKLPSLNEFLDSDCTNAEPVTPFDESTDKAFEEYALKRLNERQISG